MLKFGNEKGSQEEAIEKKWLTERYHAPSDDLNQPVTSRLRQPSTWSWKSWWSALRIPTQTFVEIDSFFRRYATN